MVLRGQQAVAHQEIRRQAMKEPNKKIRSYRDLVAWQKAMDLALLVYQTTKAFPDEEKFGLTNQIRRASVSVPSNIAEGHARLYTADFRHHLSIARGSLAEVETQLQLAVRLSYLNRSKGLEVWRCAQETGRLLNGLIKSIENLK
ncbi:MAG: four helix bundle protein [Candidatus Sumerlaeota bacterium]|nr:four helix bundle protein [Candidatus Sumerlaeota bacterium]